MNRIVLAALVTSLVASLFAPVTHAQPLVTRIATVTVAVADYDQAVDWYTQKLGLVKVHDQKFGAERFVTVAPEGQRDLEIALARIGMTAAERERGKDAVGKSGPLVFHTADCRRTYAVLRERGVEFKEVPHEYPWGVQAVALDLYGNSIVLLQPR